MNCKDGPHYNRDSLDALCYAQKHQLFTDAFFLPCRVHQDGIAVNDIAVCVNKLEQLSIDAEELNHEKNHCG